MQATEIDSGPYVGSRPYERTKEDQQRFFGRDREVEELVSDVLAHNLLLVYAPSGAGKTSLLNAGVIPQLEGEGFDVLPRGRVGVTFTAIDVLDSSTNPYVLNLLCSLSPEVDAATLKHTSIVDRLRQLPRREHAEGRVLIIDQAEELFSFTPANWQVHQKEFLIALREALRDAPDLRVVIVTREDYLARFDDCASLLPDGLRVRFRLEPLGRAAAREAVEAPLRATQRHFEEGVAEKLVEELSKNKIAVPSGGTREEPGPYVEPVQLQIVCSALWNKLPADITVITAEHMHKFGDVEETLERFYTDTIEACVATTLYDKEKLAHWFGDELITQLDTRGQVFRGATETGGLPNYVVAFLEARHLLRADERASGRWYELAHDRLVRPIRTVNERWTAAGDAARASRKTRDAVLRWVAVGLLAMVLVGIVGAAILIPTLQARSREHALTTGRIEQLRQECPTRTPECNKKAVRVLDFVADYYLRQKNIDALVEVLKHNVDLIPEEYGWETKDQDVAPVGGVDVLNIEYNPQRPLDAARMQQEWQTMADALLRERGVPVLRKIALSPSAAIPVESVRVTGVAKPCGAPEPVRAQSIDVPMPQSHTLVSRALVAKTATDTKLRELFDTYTLLDGWVPYWPSFDQGPWVSVASWSLPIWRVAGLEVKSRERALASGIGNGLLEHPELVLSCDAVQAILDHAAKSAPNTVAEAIRARGIERIRSDFISVIRDANGALTCPANVLDTLVDITSSDDEAFSSSSAESAGNDALRRPAGRSSVRTATDAERKGDLHRLFDGEPDCAANPVVVEIPPSLASQWLTPEKNLTEELLGRLYNLRGKFYRRYGLIAPAVKFTLARPNTNGFVIQAFDEKPTGAAPPASQALDVLVSELEATYRTYAARWVTTETIVALRAKLDESETRWLDANYSLSALKRVARYVLSPGIDSGGADTVRELPWVVRSLPFWTLVHGKNANALAASLRRMQQARTHGQTPVTNAVVLALVQAGIGALDRHAPDVAEASFRMAIRSDKDAAVAAFLAQYPSISDLSPVRRQGTLARACRSAIRTKSLPDENAYEIEDLLADAHAVLGVEERRSFELCLVSEAAAQGTRPHEVKTRLAKLLAQGADVWTADEVQFLLKEWVAENVKTMSPPRELPVIERLLTRAIANTNDESATQTLMELGYALGKKPFRWQRQLLARVAANSNPSFVYVRGDVAQWLGGFGQSDAQDALNLIANPNAPRNDLERSRWTLIRGSLLSHLAEYEDVPSGSERLVQAAKLLEPLLARTEKSKLCGYVFRELTDVYRKQGDYIRARDAVRSGVEKSHNRHMYDETSFWLELGDGSTERATEVASRMKEDDPLELDTVYVNAILAILTRQYDFEQAGRAFIYRDDKDPHVYVDYVRIMLAWALHETGRETRANELIDERVGQIDRATWKSRLEQQDSMVWREMLVAFFAGELSSSQILDPLRDEASFRASGLDKTELGLNGMRTEAYFYSALRERMTGDPTTRDQRFRDKLKYVLQLKQFAYTEYAMARFLLAQSGS